MELKVDHTPEEALEQIKNKNYKLRFQGKLAEKKVTVKKILGIGISYDRKTKKHLLLLGEIGILNVLYEETKNNNL